MARMTLAQARDLIGWSTRRLAKEAGGSPSNIADLESTPPRNANPGFALVMAIIGAFQRGGLVGLKAEDIFAIHDESPVREGRAS